MNAADVFDALGLEYQRAWSHQPTLHGTLAWLTATLRPGARVLDVGAGTGIPVAKTLAAAGMRVTGIDVSPVMVDLATEQVPDGTFIKVDVRDFECEPQTWDAICAVFSLLQMSRDDINTTLKRMAGWLRPGGYLFIATVPADIETMRLAWMGQEIEVSSFTEEEFERRLVSAGLRIVRRSHPVFTPDYPGATPEESLYLVSRRG